MALLHQDAAELPPPSVATTPPSALVDQGGESLTVPLTYIASLSAYVVYYSVGRERFGAIVDTGSPFLVVPSYCNRQTYGCYVADQSWPSGLAPTVGRFDNNQGPVEWRVAPFGFVNATGSMMGPPAMVFGVLSESLLNGPGGVFFGSHSRYRPVDSSIVFGTNQRPGQIDLRDSAQPKTLTLSTRSSIFSNNDEVYIVRDLNRKYGDPVVHYTARASTFRVNGKSVLASKDHQPIYVIFDRNF